VKVWEVAKRTPVLKKKREKGERKIYTEVLRQRETWNGTGRPTEKGKVACDRLQTHFLWDYP
jgi:hypothetical protein